MIECMKTAAKLPERNEEKVIEEKANKKQTEHIYISGPITGTSDYMERFEKAEKELMKSLIPQLCWGEWNSWKR